MAEMTIYAELPKGADGQRLANEIEKRLSALETVESVEAQPQSPRVAAEIIAGIAITVSIIKGTKDMSEALHQAIPKIKLVLQDLGLMKVKADIEGEQVPLEKLTRAHEQKLSSAE